MAFTITKTVLVPPPATNKGDGNQIAIKCKQTLDICYDYIRGGDSKGYVLNPRIDFLVVTIPITDPDTKGILATSLSNIQTDISEPEFEAFNIDHLPLHAKSSFKKYTHGVIINSLPGLAVFQAKPTKSDHHFLKISIVPSRWEKKDVKKFWNYLYEITGAKIDADYVIKHGSIRRIDWAIDFLNVDTTDFMLQKKSKNKRKNVSYFGPDGGVETYYIGPNGQKLSPQNFKTYIYDKRAKSNIDKEVPEFGDILHMRLEIRLNKSTLGSMNLNSFLNLKEKATNRFSSYTLTDYFAHHPKENVIQWHQFGDSCKVRGIDGALSMLTEYQYTNYKEALSVAQEICWRPDKLWKATQNHARFLFWKSYKIK